MRSATTKGAIISRRSVHPSVGTTSTTPNTSPLPAAATVTATPALVARGKALYSTDGCSACHSLTGAAGAGPTFKGLAGSTSTLANDQMVTADDAYLRTFDLRP